MSETTDDAAAAAPASPAPAPTPEPPLPAAVPVAEPGDPLDDATWARVVQGMIDKATAGSERASEMLRKERRFRPRRMRIDVPPVLDAASAAQAQGQLIVETFAGRIDPRDGSRLSAMVENRRRAIEMLDFEKQLQALSEASAELERNKRGGRP